MHHNTGAKGEDSMWCVDRQNDGSPLFRNCIGRQMDASSPLIC